MHRSVGVALAVITLLLATSPAALAAEGSIVHVETTKRGLQLVVSVPPEAEVDLAGVEVTINGQPATAEAVPANTTTAVRRTAVLAIDVSESMRGERFSSAQQAALTFLDAVPDDIHVGIVTFAGSVSEPLAPTRDRAAARAVIEGLALERQTHLYDGILAGVAMAGTEGQRTLLVLSDGADTSETPLAEVTAAITDAGVLVDVVAVEQAAQDQVALQQVAAAGGGRVIDAEASALRDTFTQQADILARQVLVTAQVPDSVTVDEASISVTLPSGDTAVTAGAFAPISEAGAEQPPAGADAAPDRGPVIPETWMFGGLAAVGVGLLALLVLLVPRRARPLTAAERASTYTSRLSDRGAARAESVPTRTQATDAVAKVLKRNAGFETRVAARLEGAGNSLKPAEWLILHAAIFIGAGTLGLLLGKGSLVVGLLFLAFGALGPWLWLGIKRSKRRKAFSSSLPDSLQLMSGSLAAGLSLAQSVDTIVREGVEPISSEYKRVLIEARLGVSLEDALEGIAERYESKDFAWVVMAIKIQRQVGGNLAELLNTVATTMREREYMRRQVAALAAEGKLSAWVLGGLPPGFLLYLLVGNREYVMPMFTEPIGWLMLIGMGTLLGVGVFWMSRLIKVEV